MVENTYIGDENTLYHFDMYRVNTLDDLCSTGYFDYIDSGILVIEWSENIEDVLPKNAIRVSIQYGESENERVICIEGANLSEDFGD